MSIPGAPPGGYKPVARLRLPPKASPYGAEENTTFGHGSKATMVSKIKATFARGDTSWATFCELHGNKPGFRPEDADEALLATFLDTLPPPPAPGGKGGKKGGGKAQGGGYANQAGRLFIGALPMSTTHDTLHAKLSEYGLVDKIDMRYARDTGAFRGFAFVTFQDPEVADLLCQAPEGTIKFEGRTLNIKPDGDPPPGKGPGKGKRASPGQFATVAPVDGDDTKLYVGGLPEGSTEDTVRAHYSQFGEVLAVEIKTEVDGSSKGFGYVTFASKASAQLVLQNHATIQSGSKGQGKGGAGAIGGLQLPGFGAAANPHAALLQLLSGGAAGANPYAAALQQQTAAANPLAALGLGGQAQPGLAQAQLALQQQLAAQQAQQQQLALLAQLGALGGGAGATAAAAAPPATPALPAPAAGDASAVSNQLAALLGGTPGA